MSSASEENSGEEAGIGELRIQDVRSVPDGSADAEVQIKSEPEDAGYEIAILGNVSITEQINQQLNNEVWSSVAASIRESEDAGSHGPNVPMAKRLKDAEKSGAPADVTSLIDGLLLKNEYLLSQNDASHFKPYSRAYKHRSWNSSGSKEPRSEKSTSYYSSPSPPKLVSVSGSSKRGATASAAPSSTSNSAPPSFRETNGSGQTSGATVESPLSGLVLKPRCPTRKCKIPQQDRSHFNLALMESKVLDPGGHEMFRIHKHELVCAVSCNTLMINPAKTVVAQFDMKYYWCNFCQFNTSSKDTLLSHVMEHRFNCKYCHYQSFSRADVIHHSSSAHSKFFNTASVLSFCTLLPDYLQVTSQTSDGDSTQQQQQQEETWEENAAKAGSMESEDGADGAPDQKVQRKNGEMVITLQEDELEENFEAFKLMVGDVGPQESPAGQRRGRASQLSTELHTEPILAEAHPTVVSMLADVTGSSLSSGESSPPLQIAFAPSPPPAKKAKHSSRGVASPIGDSYIVMSSSSPAGQKKAASQSSGSLKHVRHISSLTKSREKGTQLGSGISSQDSSERPSPGSSTASTSSHNPGSISLSRAVGVKTFQIKEGDEGSRKMTLPSVLWKCGYCEYQSALKSDVKLHSTRDHAEKPRRYVANFGKSGKASGTSTHSTRKRVRVQGENESDSEMLDWSEGSHDDLVPTIDGHDSDTDLTPPSSKSPKGARRSLTPFRCFHCMYSAKRFGVMKNHIFNTHKGACLVALDLSNPLKERPVRFCLRDGCRFFTENGNKFKRHVNTCTPWNGKAATDVKVEDHLLSCLDKTINFSPEETTPELSEPVKKGGWTPLLLLHAWSVGACVCHSLAAISPLESLRSLSPMTDIQEEESMAITTE